MFELSVSPPDPTRIPSKADLIGVTVMMITALYRRQEFFRCSYFVYNNYKDPALCADSDDIFIDQVVRSILVDKPRARVNEIIWEYARSVKMVPENLTKIIAAIQPGKPSAKIKKTNGQKRNRRAANN